MPVSPRDFELYSRMTGASMPTDAISRARMAPEVYSFTRNFAKSPNILDKAGEMVKGIGRTFQRGIGAGIQADLSEAKAPYRPTSQNYGQRVSENQTSASVLERKGVQGIEITGDVSTIAEEISGGQASHSDSTSVDSDVKKNVQAVAGSMPLTTKEMLQSGGSDNMFTRNLEKTIAGDGMQEIGGEKGGKEKLQEFLASGALLDPSLQKAVEQSNAPEALEGFKGLLSGRFGDHSQLEGGEDNTGARSQEFAKEVEDVKVNPAATSTFVNPTIKSADDFVAMVEEMKGIKPSGARTDLQIGGMKRKGEDLGKSVGISFLPGAANGDAVTFNYMEDPTKPQDVTKRSYSATPEAMQQLQSGEGDLGSGSFGQQFNKAIRRMAGLGSIDANRFDNEGFLI